jgi:hypothetical protein
MPRTAFLTLCHRRHALLGLLNRQRLLVDPTSVLAFTLDRPSTDVIRVVEKLQRDWPDSVVVNTAPFPALDAVERFNELRNWQVDQLRDYNPKYFVIFDDDGVFAEPAALRRAMSSVKDPDIVYATKLFLWDGLDRTNSRLPTHRSSIAFKIAPGETFPPLNMDEVRRPPSTKVMDVRSPLLDIGYLTDTDRRRCWDAYKRVGKIDAATLPLAKDALPMLWMPRTRTEVITVQRIARALKIPSPF